MLGMLADVGSADIPYSVPSVAKVAEQDYANEQARKAEGCSAPYRALAGTIEAAVPVANVRGMEEAANRGDTAGVLGHAAAATAMAVAPLAADVGVAKANEWLKPTEAESHANIIKALDTPPGKGGARAAEMENKVQIAHGDIGNIQRLNHIEGKGAEAFHRAARATESYNDTLWEQGHEPGVDLHGNAPTGKGAQAKLVEAGKSAVPSPAETANPEQDANTNAWIDNVVDRPRTVRQLDNFIRRLNRQLRSKEAAGWGDSGIAARQAVVKAARQVLDDRLEDLGDKGVKDVNRRWGALNAIQNRLEEKAVQVARLEAKEGPLPEWAHVYGFLHPGAELLPVSLGAGIKAASVFLPDYGSYLVRGFKGLERLGLEQPPPEAPMGPQWNVPARLQLPPAPAGWESGMVSGRPVDIGVEGREVPQTHEPYGMRTYYMRGEGPAPEFPEGGHAEQLPIEIKNFEGRENAKQSFGASSGATQGPKAEGENVGARPVGTEGSQGEPSAAKPPAAAKPAENGEQRAERVLSVDSGKAKGWAGKASDQTKADVIGTIQEAADQGSSMGEIFDQFGASMMRAVAQDAGIPEAELKGMIKGDGLTHQGQVHLGQILRSWVEKGGKK